MDENRKNLWDVRIGIFAPILTAFGIIVGVLTFSISERNKVSLEHRLIFCRDHVNFQREIWLLRADAYTKISETVGLIAASEAAGKVDEEAIISFLNQYWGVMLLVEDPNVERAMRQFRTEIEHFESGWSPPFALRAKAHALGADLKVSMLDREVTSASMNESCRFDSDVASVVRPE